MNIKHHFCFLTKKRLQATKVMTKGEKDLWQTHVKKHTLR